MREIDISPDRSIIMHNHSRIWFVNKYREPRDAKHESFQTHRSFLDCTACTADLRIHGKGLLALR